MNKPSFWDRLQQRWQLRSRWQLVRVLLVFALTGTSVLLLKPYLLDLTGLSTRTGWLDTVLYLIVILPVYQTLLLAYGFLLGEFAFFWEFEKKMLRRMLGKKAPEGQRQASTKRKINSGS